MKPILIPDPNEFISPCDENETYDLTLQMISCAARKSQTYVVINIKEKEICTDELLVKNQDNRNCSSNGYNKYNTNIVFDRNGVVISR